ncbi:DUF3630 family protein [Gallaecimonas sp. GXIMD4217]|uniref:DUF3630 family protein n=1 Tax=Gallaecimonas sp. GXIMD4217 TaxID=3131927 RepID=UPI00311AEBCB
MKLDKDARTLLLDLDSDWDSFEQDIQPWLARLELQVHGKDSGADRHQWQVSFEGTELRLEFEGLGDSTWLAADDDEGLEVLTFLYGWLQRQPLP